MHSLDMPAGWTVRLTATARAAVDRHRWDVLVYGRDAPATPRLAYGSHIGDGDCEQRIDIPAQEVDCRFEVRVRHAAVDGTWEDDWLTIVDDVPDRLDLGFSDRSQAVAHDNDVLLSFVLTSP